MELISILIVEDVTYMREFVANEILALNGAQEIYKADNSATAVVSMTQHRPKLMILDINIPAATVDGVRYRSGIDVLRVAHNQLPDSTIIMLTNNANEYYRRECKKAGAHFFFDKTNEFDEFLALIKKLINTSVQATSPSAPDDDHTILAEHPPANSR